MTTRTKEEIALIAHLLRRAGFGAAYEQLEAYAAKGYEETVEELLHPEEQPPLEEDLLMRLQPDWGHLLAPTNGQRHWIYRMIRGKRPLEEKTALFWHGIHCTGYAKVTSFPQMIATIKVFHQYGLGSFRDLLVQLAKDPGMIYFLDNCISHKWAINENWGRELLELFSIGVGNYTEEDVKEAARAFTGWTIPPIPPVVPFGFYPWEFLYDRTDHDGGERVFLGHRGRFNGEDIIDIICQQPATAGFVARHLYNFFVADEAPVPQWPFTPPRDPAAIEVLSKAYFDYHYDLRSMLRVLFNADFFKSARFAKLKSPAEVVVGTIRLVENLTKPRPGLLELAMECAYMGQDLLSPPTVEGWHTGQEWIDSGTLVERINFVADQLGDVDKPGVRKIIQRLKTRGEALGTEEFLDGCLEQLGCIEIWKEARGLLVEYVRKDGEVRTGTEGFGQRVGQMLQLIAATREYQFG